AVVRVVGSLLEGRQNLRLMELRQRQHHFAPHLGAGIAQRHSQRGNGGDITLLSQIFRRLGAHAVSVPLLQEHDRRVAAGRGGGRRRGGLGRLPPHPRSARKGKGKNDKNGQPARVPHLFLAVSRPTAPAAVAQTPPCLTSLD